jgi:hypothetical protein
MAKKQNDADRTLYAAISRLTEGRQINIFKMGPYRQAVKAQVLAGVPLDLAVTSQIDLFYEPAA